MLPLNKKPYRVFSLWLRIFHWTMVLCVTALFWTGLYIGNPGFQATPGSVEPTIAVGGWFSMEMIRKIHFIAAFILIAALIFRMVEFDIVAIDCFLDFIKSRIGLVCGTQLSTI